MAKYKVYECESTITKGGKALKKLVLQGEGKQYPDKNVAMWGDHPLFEDVSVGQTIDVEIDTKDSTTPNPHGGFYKNKTVLRGAGSAPRQDQGPASKDPATAELKNILNIKLIPLTEQNNAGILNLERKINEALAQQDRILKLLAADENEDEPGPDNIPFD